MWIIKCWSLCLSSSLSFSSIRTRKRGNYPRFSLAITPSAESSSASSQICSTTCAFTRERGLSSARYLGAKWASISYLTRKNICSLTNLTISPCSALAVSWDSIRDRYCHTLINVIPIAKCRKSATANSSRETKTVHQPY